MAIPQTTKTIMTADDLLVLPDDGYQYDLIEGELVRMPPAGGESSRQELHVAWLIKSFVVQHKLGVVYGPSPGFVLGRTPDTVLAPDVAFIRSDRRPSRVEE
jgi:Uma2 family endonuclease